MKRHLIPALAIACLVLATACAGSFAIGKAIDKVGDIDIKDSLPLNEDLSEAVDTGRDFKRVLEGTPPSGTADDDDLSVSDVYVDSSQRGLRTVVGKVTNNSDDEFSFIQIQFDLYDGINEKVGSAVAIGEELPPGGTWEFRAPVLDDSAVRAEVARITGF